MRGKNVVLISKEDFAGSGYRMVESINLYSCNNVQYVRLIPQPMSFPKLPSVFYICDGGYNINRPNLDDLNKVIEKADILHFKGDYLPIKKYFPLINIPKNIPKIITVGGMYFRRGKSIIADELDPLSKYVKLTQYRSALTADLNYPEYKGHFTQHPIDIDNMKYSWHKNNKIVIAHAPTNEIKKGTIIFLQAIKKLNNKNIEIDIIKDTPYYECLKRISKASLFFDQCLFEAYGNASIEAMSMGIPLITRLTDKAISQSEGKLENTPIIRCDDTPESIIDAINRALDMDLKDISIKTREFCEKTYSYEIVGRMWDKIYHSEELIK